KGDTLSAIAKRVYGKASYWQRIFDANRDTIDNPDRIFPGQMITLPEIEEAGEGRAPPPTEASHPHHPSNQTFPRTDTNFPRPCWPLPWAPQPSPAAARKSPPRPSRRRPPPNPPPPRRPRSWHPPRPAPRPSPSAMPSAPTTASPRRRPPSPAATPFTPRWKPTARRGGWRPGGPTSTATRSWP